MRSPERITSEILQHKNIVKIIKAKLKEIETLKFVEGSYDLGYSSYRGQMTSVKINVPAEEVAAQMLKDLADEQMAIADLLDDYQEWANSSEQ